MEMAPTNLREQAEWIWGFATKAAAPKAVVRSAISLPLESMFHAAPRIIVVGGGKAGGAMAAGLEDALAASLDRVEGLVNVPEGTKGSLRKVVLRSARPAGSNFPTEQGVAGAERMLRLLADAGPDDVAICLLSGGGSALLPAPVDGVSLADKQATTKLLHASGASIDEMNAVRKHLSRLKGGGMAKAFRGRKLLSLIISDVVGDPLDVIASGPTAPDPSTFGDALVVLKRFGLLEEVPPSVRLHLEAGVAGGVPETLKEPLPNVEHRILASNARSLQDAETVAKTLGFERTLNLGAFIEGETREVAFACAGMVRSILRDGGPLKPPCCILLGGETTVTLGPNPGKGGRNQEFVLALLHKLGGEGIGRVMVLSAGTDGEDGPTDAAGAVAGPEVLAKARLLGLDPADHLRRHDAYPLFDRTGALLRTGLTGTNVMDVRIILIR